MPQYIVLKPISPKDGPIIFPAAEPTKAEPTPAPVLVEEALFSGDTPEDRAKGIAYLIEQGVIALYDAPKTNTARKAKEEN